MSVPASGGGLERLAALVGEAGARARGLRRPVLVSVVERAPVGDPLAALEAARVAVERSGAATGQMYWARPADGFAMTGIGAAVTLAPSGADRFAVVDADWRRLLDAALVDDPSGGAAGAGPVLLGGFAFEPGGPRTARWRGFPAARLTLPRLLLTRSRDAGWLTTNVLVGPDGRPDIDLPALAALRGASLAAAAVPAPSIGTPADVVVRGDVRGDAEWRHAVEEAVAVIRAGALTKVVLAREVRAVTAGTFDVGAVLRVLRAAHPDCYVFGCWSGERAFVGASPERLVRLDGDVVRASSLAGSIRRGATAPEDAALVAELLASAKDREEHEVVRHFLCATLGTLCDDVTAATVPDLLSLPTVHHLHTPVQARLRPGHSLLDVVARLHPTPAVGGEPRDGALHFLRTHERLDRGWYAAPIGWLQRGRGEFAVALRSAIVSPDEAWLFAGCGIVADSDPEREYAESVLKLRPMTTALEQAADATPAVALRRAAGGGGAR